MTEEMWERVCDCVSARLKKKEHFYSAVKNGLLDCGIRDYDQRPRYYCQEVGKRLGARRRKK